jgi:uncharacterized OsmC-like protein
MSSVPGFNTEKLDEFSAYASEHPEKVLLGLEAKTIWEGYAVENLAKIGRWELGGEAIEKPERDYSIQFGAWKEVEEAIGIPGAHDRIEPMEGALAAMASCVSTAITINAARENLSLDGLEVTARASVDPRVLLGIVPAEEADSCLKSVDVEINVRGDLTEAQREQVLLMAQRSPVHAMVSGSNKITTRLT